MIKKRIAQGSADLCRCNPAFENRGVCQALATLNDQEREFCSKVTAEIAPEILRLTESSGVTIRWTSEPISVTDLGQARTVDAVTDPKSRQITIDIKRFREMKPFERVFLLTHELAHLTFYREKPLVDQGPIGPFEGSEGGRRLLNAIGATAAVQQGAFPREIRKYRGRLLRSQSWKPIWFFLQAGSSKYQGLRKQTFASDRFDGGGIGARYQLEDWSFTAGYRGESHNFTALDTILVDETKDIFSLGVGYRIFPFSDPMSYWGQSHLRVEALVDFVRARIRLREQYVSDLEEKKSTTGESFSATYHFPFLWGFWAYLGGAYEIHPYKYSKVNVNYDKNLISTFAGVEYGF